MRAHTTHATTAAVVALAFLALLGTGTHTVARGETLGAIASRYGTTTARLASANGLAATATGSLVCPVRGPMRHVNDWGFPCSGGRFHEGNDLFAARGTPLVAVTGGQLVQTVGRIGGKQIKLVGDDDVTYYYTHLDSFGAAATVDAGAVIGTVGTSGNAAGGPPHVHFEVHPAGGPAVNPYPRLEASC